MNKLKNKMMFSYSLIALLIIVILGVLFNGFVDGIFKDYAMKQQETQIKNILEQVNEQYVEETGLYDLESLEIIGNAALQNGFIIHIQTVDKEIHWDIQQHKSQECLILLQHAEKNMHSRYPNFQGGYMENTYDLKSGDALAGSLTVGYYGPYSLGDNELLLIKELNRMLVILAGVFLLLCIVLGFIMARNVTKPITSVIRTAREIANGRYGIQDNTVSSTLETKDLVKSINRMSLELEKKEQQKEQLTADVAHELRTPLNNLQSHMEAMIDGIWAPSADRLQGCHAEIRRLTQIVEQLQELYTMEHTSDSFMMETFEFTELSGLVLKEFEIPAQSKGVHLIQRMPCPAPVYGDIQRIKQCLVNLVANAIRYTPSGGTITLSYEKDGCDAVIRLSDEGPGIPEEDLSYVFDRFYRVDKSRNQSTGGMGIGLSITQAIIVAHGGSIVVENQKNIGLVFTICLPAENHHKIATSL